MGCSLHWLSRFSVPAPVLLLGSFGSSLFLLASTSHLMSLMPGTQASLARCRPCLLCLSLWATQGYGLLVGFRPASPVLRARWLFVVALFSGVAGVGVACSAHDCSKCSPIGGCPFGSFERGRALSRRTLSGRVTSSLGMTLLTRTAPSACFVVSLGFGIVLLHLRDAHSITLSCFPPSRFAAAQG